jgi:hypothetical protein
MQKINIPQVSYQKIVSIIKAYASYTDSATNQELADESKVKVRSISISNAFLVDLGIIEVVKGKEKRKITKLGLQLGNALISYPRRVSAIWREIISDNPFFKDLISELSSMPPSELSVENIRGAIVLTSGIPSERRNNTDYSTGINAVIEILIKAGHLKKDKGIFQVIPDEQQYETDVIPGKETDVLPTVGDKVLDKKVFIVHGHDEAMKQSVARILEALGLSPIILHEQPDNNRTIIEKFLNYSSSSDFAVVLFSPDDEGYSTKVGAKRKKKRPRQNVIFELGFFLGRLGRDKVLVLLSKVEDFEILSDYSGVLYKEFDDKGNWKYELVRELKSSGFEVDANKLYK